MKRFAFFATLIVLPFLLEAQAPFPNAAEIGEFNKSKTCVVLDDNQFSVWNSMIRKAVKTYWNITAVEYIDQALFEERRKDPAYSFITLTQTSFEKDKANTSFNYINLIQGKDVEKIGQMPEICAVPVSSADQDDLDSGYKMGAILRFMQKHAQMISDDPYLTGRRYLKYYNKNIPRVAGKVILARQEDLSAGIASVDKIKTYLSNDFRIVSEEDIVSAVNEKAPNTLILHVVGPPPGKSNSGYCLKMLFGADDDELYYYNQQKIDKYYPAGLLPEDLKRLAR